MKTDYFPLYDDTADRIAELNDEQTERVRTLKSSLEWYQRQSERHGGWSKAIDQCKEELEELAHTSDLARLDEVLGDDDDDVAELDETEQAIAECEERIQWYENHDWQKAAEREYDRLSRLKGGT
jgi:hypothetical protein